MRLETVKISCAKKANTADFSADVQEGEDFDEYVAQLHHYITDIKNLQIGQGFISWDRCRRIPICCRIFKPCCVLKMDRWLRLAVFYPG